MLTDGLRQLVSHMAGLYFWVTILCIFGIGLWLLHIGTRAFWRLRTVTDTPSARVLSAPQGYVELSGFAQPHSGLSRARLTQTPCLWYRFRVEEQRRSGRRNQWVTIEEGETSEPFLLSDASGQCLVEPTSAQLHTRGRTRWEGHSRNPQNRSSDQSWFGMTFGRRYRFTEERIEPGDPLYVLGHFETPRRGPEEREQLQRALLRVWKRDPKRISDFDTNGDGHISLEEWERARSKAAQLAQRSEFDRSSAPVLPRVRATADPRQPFVISTYTEEELASKLRWQALGSTAGFAAIAILVGYGLIIRLGAGS